MFQDEERPHSFAEAGQIHLQLIETYRELGYEVVDIPWDGIEERASWLLARLKQD